MDEKENQLLTLLNGYKQAVQKAAIDRNANFFQKKACNQVLKKIEESILYIQNGRK